MIAECKMSLVLPRGTRGAGLSGKVYPRTGLLSCEKRRYHSEHCSQGCRREGFKASRGRGCDDRNVFRWAADLKTSKLAEGKFPAPLELASFGAQAAKLICDFGIVSRGELLGQPAQVDITPPYRIPSDPKIWVWGQSIF